MRMGRDALDIGQGDALGRDKAELDREDRLVDDDKRITVCEFVECEGDCAFDRVFDRDEREV